MEIGSKVVQQTVSTEVTKFDNFANVQEMLSFAEVMIKSKLVPSTLKQPEQVVAIITQGRELGFGAATALNNLHNIEGRVTLSVHAIAGLVRRAGAAYKLLEDRVAIRADGTADLVRLKKEVEDKEGKKVWVDAHKYIDYRTTYEFYTPFNGREIVNKVSFCWSEAISQKLHDKPTWVKMPKIMMRARALALGARLACPEALMGLMEISEVADFSNTDYNITEDADVTILN